MSTHTLNIYRHSCFHLQCNFFSNPASTYTALTECNTWNKLDWLIGDCCNDLFRGFHAVLLHLNYWALIVLLCGHPFMTSTRRGSGSGGRMWTGGGGGSSPMWTSTQKIKLKVHWRHTVFFSCKEVGVFFTRISSLDRKKVDIFLQYKLVI